MSESGMWLQHVSVPRPPGEESRTAAQAFYGGLLGLAEKPVPQSITHLDLVWFQVGPSELHVFAQSPVDEPQERHFCLVVDDVTTVRDKLTAAGHAIEETEPIPGRPRFFCRDPFGNRIELTTITGDYH